MPNGISYSQAGVDIYAATRFVAMIKERIAKAWPEAAQEIGGFAGGGTVPTGANKYQGGADGTGTKIILAALLDDFSGIGYDAVAMAAVDTYISLGTPPVAVWDVLDVAHLNPDKHIKIIESIISACQLAGCRLLGGETAELPDMFKHHWLVNLNMFALSFPGAEQIYAPVKPGQKVYGWPSYGLASNGYSLLRKVFKLNRGGLNTIRQRLRRHYPLLGGTLADAALRRTPIWIDQIELQRNSLRVAFAGHAHITGGGLVENIPRILPDNCKVVIDRGTWPRPPIFPLIQRIGKISDQEMDRVFNQGLMVVSIVSDDGFTVNTPNAYAIGQVEARNSDEPQVQLIGQYRDE